MNKIELAQEISKKTGMNHKDAFMFITAFADAISEALAEGDKVSLIGFGTFETRERNAREARNPQTGGTVHIEAKTVPAFKAGKALKAAVNK